MNETTSRVCRSALALFLGLFAAACSDAVDETKDARNGSAIVGGYEDDGHANVGAIIWDITADDGTTSIALCTGTVVTSTAILSAAHCVVPPAGQHFSNYRFTLDPAPTADSQFLPIVSVAADPAYDLGTFGGGNDVSVMILAAPVNVTPAALAGALDASLVGAPVMPVGYGLSDGIEGTGAGLKRAVKVTLTGIDDNEFTYGEAGHTTCSGDSGGPIFVNVDGQDVIVGLTSWGTAGCVEGSHATRVDRVLDFVKAAVGAATPAPSQPPQPPPGQKKPGGKKPGHRKPGGTTPAPGATVPGGTDPGGTTSSDDAIIECLVGCYYKLQDPTERTACFDDCLAVKP